ncbi:restriction endonuclease subunit S [Desulfovulcanus sp.]
MVMKKVVRKIPELRFPKFDGDWDFFCIKKALCDLIDCEHKTAPYVEESEYLVVRTNNIKDGHLKYDGIKYTTPAGFEEWTKRSAPKPRDILFTREAPAGESCLVPEDKKICLGQRMVLLRPNEEIIRAQYLSCYLQTQAATRRISNLSIRTTVTRINIADICKIKCPAPSIPEQQKIASFLSVVDKKIEQLTRKKKLLEQYKKGVMQKIFSQEIRFKDENGQDYPDWEEKSFGRIASKSKAKYNPQSKGTNYPCVELESIASGQGKLLKLFKANEQKSIKNKFDYGDVLFGKLRPNLKKYLYASFEGVCSSEIWVLKGQNVINKYLFYLVQTSRFYRISNITFGSKMPRSDWDFISSFPFNVPSMEEQQRIVDFFSSIDKKNNLAETQLTQTKKFKKGLLQKMFV